MLSPALIRCSAWSGALAGAILAVIGAVEAVLGATTATSLALVVTPSLALPLLVALHARQSDRAGALGTVGFAVNLLGLGLFGGAAFTLNTALQAVDGPTFAAVLQGPTRYALIGSAAVFAVGAALFGASMVRAGVHPRIPAAVYGVAFPAFALTAPLPDSVLTSALHVLVGSATLWLAVALTRSTGPRAEALALRWRRWRASMGREPRGR